jgi:hypothetical protein
MYEQVDKTMMRAAMRGVTFGVTFGGAVAWGTEQYL